MNKMQPGALSTADKLSKKTVPTSERYHGLRRESLCIFDNSCLNYAHGKAGFLGIQIYRLYRRHDATAVVEPLGLEI